MSDAVAWDLIAKARALDGFRDPFQAWDDIQEDRHLLDGLVSWSVRGVGHVKRVEDGDDFTWAVLREGGGIESKHETLTAARRRLAHLADKYTPARRVRGVGRIEPMGSAWAVRRENGDIDSAHQTLAAAHDRLGELAYAEAMLQDDAWEPI